MPAKLQIVSSARVKVEHAVVAAFGEQDAGKTMLIPTAPKPLWVLFEGTRKESLTEELISQVYPPPTREQVAAIILKHEPAIPKAELEKEVSAAMTDLPGFTGITYDVQKVQINNYEELKSLLDFLKTPEAAPFETICIDSASVANQLVKDYYANKKTKAGNKAHGAKASREAQDETYEWFCQCIEIPKNWLFLFRGEDKITELGTGDDMIRLYDLAPAVAGNKLKREFKHLFSNIFQVKKGPPDDAGKPTRYLQCRANTPNGVERTLCPRVGDTEPTNLTDLFNKLKG